MIMIMIMYATPSIEDFIEIVKLLTFHDALFWDQMSTSLFPALSWQTQFSTIVILSVFWFILYRPKKNYQKIIYTLNCILWSVSIFVYAFASGFLLAFPKYESTYNLEVARVVYNLSPNIELFAYPKNKNNLIQTYELRVCANQLSEFEERLFLSIFNHFSFNRCSILNVVFINKPRMKTSTYYEKYVMAKSSTFPQGFWCVDSDFIPNKNAKRLFKMYENEQKRLKDKEEQEKKDSLHSFTFV